MGMFESKGFVIEQTGGGCTAWQKQDNDAFVWITNRDGTHHELLGETDHFIIGLYAADDTGASLIEDAALHANTQAEAVCVAHALLAAAKFIPHHKPEDALRLAIAFGQEVQEALTYRQFGEVVSLNKTESNAGVCHTHDYTDANMLMHAAFTATFGRDCLDGEMTQADTNLWNEAWNIAKAAEFFA